MANLLTVLSTVTEYYNIKLLFGSSLEYNEKVGQILNLGSDNDGEWET